MNDIENAFDPLMNFIFNCLIVISWVSLSFWVITGLLMLGGTIPVVNDFNSWTLFLVPFNFIVFMIWSYRMMVLNKPCFFGSEEK